MSMNKHNQHGSAHVVAIGAVAVIIIGATGFLFWNNFLKPQPTAENVVTATPTPGSSPSPEPVVEEQAYVVIIGDWNVEFELSDTLEAADVKAKQVTNEVYPSGTMTYYEIATSQQRAFDLQRDGMERLCDAGSPVSLDRYDSDQSKNAAANGFTGNTINSKPIDGYYYYWSIPSAGACEGPDTKAIVEALKTLKAS
jgi:hypothetical protein